MEGKHEKDVQQVQNKVEEKSLSQRLYDEVLSTPQDFLNAFRKRPVESTIEFLILDPLAPLIHEKIVKEPPAVLRRRK
jgi:hypothetical protein